MCTLKTYRQKTVDRAPNKDIALRARVPVRYEYNFIRRVSNPYDTVWLNTD